MRIYVNNLHYQTTEKQLRDMFEAFGTVSSARIKNNRFSTQRAIFAFIEMDNEDEAAKAVAALHNTPFQENTLEVAAAKVKSGNSWRFKS